MRTTAHGLSLFLVAAGLGVSFAAPLPRVAVEPRESRLRLGEGRQLAARLSGLPRGTIARWRLVDGPGALSPTGYYQAPVQGSTPAVVRVAAEVDGIPGFHGEAVVHLEPVRVEIRPARVELSTGETFRFQARVSGAQDERVTWSVEPGPDGTGMGSAFDGGRVGANGLFTAPTRFPTPGTITVRARSTADPGKSAAAQVLLRGVELSVSPAEARLQHGQSRRFTAKVTGTANQSVRWEVLGEGMGQISATGLYTTPPVMTTPAVVTVVARSSADPTKTAAARVRIDEILVGGPANRPPQPRGRRRGFARVAHGIYRAAAPRVVQLIMPFDPVDFLVRGPQFRGRSGKRYVPLGGAVPLDVGVYGTTYDTLKWEIVGGGPGEVGEDGVYRAPDRLTTPQLVQVRATSAADPTKSALYTLHIPPVLVDARQNAESCLLDGAVQLEAKVQNSEDARIRWSVEGGDRFGTVSEAGLYHPPASLATPAVVRVRATSVADPTKDAVIQVQIPEVRLALTPGEATVRPGRTVRLKPRVEGCTARQAGVDWTLTPEAGRIAPDGTYQAPETDTPMEVQVTAVLRSDPTKTAVTVLRIRP